MAAPARNPPLFPPFVAQHSVTFDEDDRIDPVVTFPEVTLPATLAGAVAKRRLEYLAGRTCAREALRRLACEQADVTIGTGTHREPLWPPGFVGAITHTHGFASAAVARASDARGVGLDVEHVTTSADVPSLAAHIATHDEMEELGRTTGWELRRLFTVVFSAKETIFKCLYPEVRRYFDFLDARVLVVDPAAGRFAAKLLVDLAPRLLRGLDLEGRFEEDGASVVTAMTLGL